MKKLKDSIISISKDINSHDILPSSCYPSNETLNDFNLICFYLMAMFKEQTLIDEFIKTPNMQWQELKQFTKYGVDFTNKNIQIFNDLNSNTREINNVKLVETANNFAKSGLILLQTINDFYKRKLKIDNNNNTNKE